MRPKLRNVLPSSDAQCVAQFENLRKVPFVSTARLNVWKVIDRTLAMRNILPADVPRPLTQYRSILPPLSSTSTQHSHIVLLLAFILRRRSGVSGKVSEAEESVQANMDMDMALDKGGIVPIHSALSEGAMHVCS